MNQEMRRQGSEWNMDVVAKNREVAYAMTKVESERLVYAEGRPMDLMPLEYVRVT